MTNDCSISAVLEGQDIQQPKREKSIIPEEYASVKLLIILLL
jgi:hypothetical protein